jgi:agmatine deiminase
MKDIKITVSVVAIVALFCLAGFSGMTVQGHASSSTQHSVYSFTIGSVSTDSIRQPGEFEPMQGALIRYPFGISYDIIKEMAKDVNVVTIVASVSEENTVQTQYQSHGVNLSHCSYLIAPTDTYWTRDYGPWFIFNEENVQGVVDFTYNRPRPNDDQIPTKYAINQSLPYYNMPLVATGGNYMTDGQGKAISTTLIWDENPGMTHDQINQTVHDYLGISTYYVVPDVNGEYIEHIDCWGKYLSPDTILIRQVPQSHSQYDEIEAAVSYFKNATSCYGTPYHVVRVYTPNNEPYTNSLILNNKVFVPIMNDPWDDDAIAAYQAAMPGYEVLGFTGSWESTDALHCRVMGITDRYMLYIEHTPLTGDQTSQNGFDIQAKIYPYSEQSLISGSTGVYWRVDNQTWNFLPMQPLGNDYYHAVIPGQANGTVVSYYIHAEDASGRAENSPYIGAPMAYQFTILGGQAPNTPPDQPVRPTGKESGKINTNYLYSTQTTDVDGDEVYYLWDWGDGNVSDWLGPIASGALMAAQHSWDTKGTYAVRVKAKDIHGAESNWSEPFVVTMPCDLSLVQMFVGQFFERWFPRLYAVVFFHHSWVS